MSRRRRGNDGCSRHRQEDQDSPELESDPTRNLILRGRGASQRGRSSRRQGRGISQRGRSSRGRGQGISQRGRSSNGQDRGISQKGRSPRGQARGISQRGRSSGGQGRGISQRDPGQQHRDHEGYHHPEGTPRVHHHHPRGGRPKKMKTQQQFLDFPFLDHHETLRLLPQFRVMFILRGLPGSGKSTVADAILQQYRNHAVVCSADYYRYDKGGEYVWSEDKLQETRSTCRWPAEKFTAQKTPIVVIDNTNETRSEVQRYTNLAKQYGYVVVLVEPKTPWKFEAQKLAAKSTHSVSHLEISRKVEQFDEILPQYFGWFLSPAESVRLHTMAKDVLRECVQVPEFRQCIKAFSGHSSPEFTVQNALSYYSIEQHYSDSAGLCHVTACSSPRDRSLETACGKISQLSIIGCVITKDTFSARVVLPTKEQQKLWKNDQENRRDDSRHSVEDMTRTFQRLPLADNGKSKRYDHCTHASTRVTLGTRQGIDPVLSKYDVQTVANHELSHPVLELTFEEYTLPGDIGNVRKISDTTWAVYFNKAHVVPAIFSGYYD